LIEFFVQNKNYYQAQSIIRLMRSEGSNNPLLDLYQGISLREEKLYEQAEELLVSSRKQLPRDSRPSEALCVLYADTHEVDQALSACERATKIANSPSSWNNYGFLLLSSNNTEEALVALKNAVRLDSTANMYRNNLGLAQAMNGQTKTAMHTLRTILGEADANYNIGAARERVGDTKQARMFFARAMELDPHHTQAKESWARLAQEVEKNP
jgi:Tfp pilus assembly protein PilF